MGAGGNFLWCQYSLLSCVLHGLQEYKHVQNLCLSWTSLVPRPYVGIYDLPVGTIMTRCFNKCDWEALQEDMMAVSWQKVEKCYNIDDAWNSWKSIFLEVLKTFRPRKNQLPWIHEDIWELMWKRDWVLHKYHKTNNRKLWNVFKRIRNLVTMNMRSAKRGIILCSCL